MDNHLYRLQLPDTDIEDIEENISIIKDIFIQEMENFHWDNYGRYITEYCYEENIEDYLNVDIDSSRSDIIEDFLQEYKEDFDNWLNYEIEYRIQNFIDTRKEKINNEGFIQLYRGMTVDKDFVEKISNDHKHLGICWSIEERCAETFAYKTSEKDKIILTIEVDTKEVNWLDSVLLSLDPTLSEEEQEVRLFPFSQMKIIDISLNDQKIK